MSESSLKCLYQLALPLAIERTIYSSNTDIREDWKYAMFCLVACWEVSCQFYCFPLYWIFLFSLVTFNIFFLSLMFCNFSMIQMWLFLFITLEFHLAFLDSGLVLSHSLKNSLPWSLTIASSLCHIFLQKFKVLVHWSILNYL